MKHNPFWKSAAAGLGVMMLSFAAPAQDLTTPCPNRVISWNLDSWSTVNPSDLAGLAPAYNWVDTWLNDITIGLPDNQGSTTTLDLGRGSANTYQVQQNHPGLDANGTANREMLNGYLNSGLSNWNPVNTNTWVSLTNIPYAKYDVVVYINSDTSGRRFSIDNGTKTFFGSTVGSASRSGANALFLPTTETNSTVFPTADFAFFPGMTNANAIFTERPKSGAEQWLGICAFQVIESSNVYVLYGPSPASQIVPVGQSISFSVMAGGESPTCQWRHAGTNIPGANSATYTIPAAAIGQEGDYDVVVTNDFSSVTSLAATLTLYAPKTIEWSGNSTVWDTTDTTAWTADNGSTTIAYTETDNVRFGPLGSFQPYVTLIGTRSPSSIVVSNAYYALASGEIGGAASLNLVNGATLILDTTDTSSGPVTIGAGSVLQVGNGGTTGALGSGALTNNGGLVYNRADNEAYGYPIYGTGSISNVGPSGTITFGGTVNVNYLVQSGGGHLWLQGDNHISGGLIISGGFVEARNVGALGGAQVTVFSGGELQFQIWHEYAEASLTLAGGVLHGGMSGSQGFRGPVALSADSTINIDGGNSLTLSNSAGIAGSGYVLTKTGDGTLILPAAQNAWAALNITAGTLQIGNGGATGGLGSGNVQDDGAVSFNLSGDLTVTNTFSGMGAISQIGSGTVTLTADNTAMGFGGAINVTNGTLLVNGTSGYGAVTVAGGVLGGTGTIDGPVSVLPGGTLAPGASVGMLTLNSTLSLDGGNLLFEVDKSLSPSNDVVSVFSGAAFATAPGNVTINNLGPALAVGDTFKLFSQPVTGGETMTVSGAGATWTNRLAVDGSIRVLSAAVPQPVINSVTMPDATSLVFSGTNGYPGSAYTVLSSTNVALPLSSWTVGQSGSFDANGHFSVTNSISAGVPQKFYRLSVP